MLLLEEEIFQREPSLYFELVLMDAKYFCAPLLSSCVRLSFCTMMRRDGVSTSQGYLYRKELLISSIRSIKKLGASWF
jgi:hypothetical protein